jgi:hypothetical protein
MKWTETPLGRRKLDHLHHLEDNTRKLDEKRNKAAGEVQKLQTKLANEIEPSKRQEITSKLRLLREELFTADAKSSENILDIKRARGEVESLQARWTSQGIYIPQKIAEQIKRKSEAESALKTAVTAEDFEYAGESKKRRDEARLAIETLKKNYLALGGLTID